jgi:hypothetical protein
MAALIFSIAFLPLSLFAATRIYPTLKPPKHRPFIFILSGTFMFAFGLFLGLTLREDLILGVIHFTSRYFGEIYAASHNQPLTYWAIALTLYIVAILFSGLGLAGYGLCFSGRRPSEP